MDGFNRHYPSLDFELLRQLVNEVVVTRDMLAASTKWFEDLPWGFACSACEAILKMCERKARHGELPVRFVREKGMAYTLVLGEVPLRIQPDVPEIREPLEGERLEIRRAQGRLFDEGLPGVLLRLEIAQRAGKPVRSVVLYLFEEGSEEALDSHVVYEAEQTEQESAGTEIGGAVVPMARPPQDIDTSNVFEFPDEVQKTKKDHGDED